MRAVRVSVAVALRLLNQLWRVQFDAVAVLRWCSSTVECLGALLPNTFYAQLSVVWTTERSVHVVEACINHANNYALAGVSLRQRGALVYLVGASLLACEVEHLACARCQLYVLYTLLLSQLLKCVD